MIKKKKSFIRPNPLRYNKSSSLNDENVSLNLVVILHEILHILGLVGLPGTPGAIDVSYNEGPVYIGTNGVLKGASGVQNINVWTENSAKYQFTDGSFRPLSNNSYDLGDSSLRWRNIYTNDLNLSNEGSSNDVDGTWGSYTIQEGAEDLFLVNKRNGKKYKFALTEVS